MYTLTYISRFVQYDWSKLKTSEHQKVQARSQKDEDFTDITRLTSYIVIKHTYTQTWWIYVTHSWWLSKQTNGYRENWNIKFIFLQIVSCYLLLPQSIKLNPKDFHEQKLIQNLDKGVNSNLCRSTQHPSEIFHIL